MLVNLDYVLKKAQEEKYAVGLFNTTDTDMLEAAISAAEEMNSPIIIGTAEILLPYGELDLIAPSVIAAAKRAKVPVVVHYDHGLTFERCMQALKLGFTSIMFDGSAGDSDQNIKDTAQIEKIVLHAADSMGLSQKKASLLARHSGTLQKKLQKMSDAEINRFASVLGEEQVKKLLSQLE